MRSRSTPKAIAVMKNIKSKGFSTANPKRMSSVEMTYPAFLNVSS
jgi:hypothetical protein